jgi:polysaccharide biosynthesis transport protein
MKTIEENLGEPTSNGMSLHDIIFMLFRHKWIVIICCIGGVTAAAAAYFLIPPVYESEAKLLVRYVVERSAIDSVDAQPRMAAENLINSEVEILTSRDLAGEVVQSLLGARSSGVSDDTHLSDAATAFGLGLTVTPLKGSNIIWISYKNEDPNLAKRALDELVVRYLGKHLEVHRSLGAFDFVSQQSDEIRRRIDVTESELKRLKAKEGILSFDESSTNMNAEVARTQGELRAAEIEFEELKAQTKEIEKWVDTGDENNGSSPESQRQALAEYQMLTNRISKLRQSEFDILSKYTPESAMASRVKAQIAETDAQRRSLEKKHPALLMGPASASTKGAGEPDIITLRARLAAAEAKVGALKSRLEQALQNAQKLFEVGPRIAQLERRKELDEDTYKYYQASLEKARIDEALDPTKMPNISVVQKPSSAQRVSSKLKKKIVLGLAFGGAALGAAIALLLELFLDRSVKRPLEFGTQLNIPMLSWIPMIDRSNHRLQLRDRRDKSNPADFEADDSWLSPWDAGHFVRSFAEELRDRLLLYFEIRKTTHKPKLVAVTSCSRGAGTSTIAGGLATALSECGDGKVLLVDMRDSTESVHPYFDGCPIVSMSDALDSKGAMCAAAENLYLAIAALPESGGASIAPRTFYNMVPRFQSSDFDYVIFDMPPMDESSSALAVARFMDKVLMVVESEKNHRDTVVRSYSDLRRANVNVSAVLNKTRSYTPKWLGFDA